MMSIRIQLRLGGATAAMLVGCGVQAQTTLGGMGQADGTDIVVTATKRNDTINRVPISMTAVTQKTLDEQGVKNIGDLARTVPALTLQRTGADSAPNIAIRGIYSVAGSPTTGIYLDDVPLQKRNALSFSGNGSPIPEIFDLERVEVLRGPQGTLYGGSSEGGTVRFITPATSLTRYSAYGRAELSFTKDGAPSEEAGVALGGPIVQDKLGFRISLWDRETGGYIDHVDVTDPSTTYKKNANFGSSRAARAVVKWQATDKLSITPSFYYSYDYANDVDTYWQGVVQSTTTAYTNASTGFAYPAHTYGPYTQFGTYKSGNPYHSPRTTKLYVSSVSLDYDLGWANLKSISSYVHDTTNGVVDEAGFSGEARNLQGGIGFVAELPNFRRRIVYGNSHDGVTQEIRLASSNPNGRFSWVGGLYYSYSKIHTTSSIYEDLDSLSEVLRGTNTAGVYKAPLLDGDLASYRYQSLIDKEYAAFGELYYRLTDKLKLTAGVRVSHTEFDYDQTYYGALAGFITPTTANAGLSSGKQKSTPVTPKFGVTYQINPDEMVYFNAAKGFRNGGVNPTVSQTTCAAGLAVYGGTPPTTYKSDSVWSFELGSKARLLDGHAQVQASAFYIDWNSPQLFETFPGCSAQYTTNAGHAISRGGDLQVKLHPFGGFTLSVAASYTDAHYSEAVLGPTPVAGATRSVIANKGDPMPVAPWNVNVSAQYSFADWGEWHPYLRGDFQYASAYKRTTGPGTVAYAPEQYHADSTKFMSARVGANRGPWELSLFVDNLFNSTDTLSQITGGRGTCKNTACTSYAINEPLYIGQTFRPRTIGLQAAFRY